MYGLLGKTLKHSFSKEIHNLLGNLEYEIIETDDLKSFFAKNQIQGINVTIPYKEKVISYLSQIDEFSKRIGAVNTIVKKNDMLCGYNTDYIGFKKLLSHYQINVENKRVLIVGNGGAAKTCEIVLKDLHSLIVTKICRHPNGENEIPFNLIDTVLDYDIIVNTTPVGMYPNNEDDFLFRLDEFHSLSCVIDLIYNPSNTKLLLEAKSKMIPAYNGLFMLVMQAIRAHELFFDVTISEEESFRLYQKIKRKMVNLVFVGLPLSGKTKYATLFSTRLDKDLVDTDESIERLTQKKITDIFENEGESSFRKVESSLVDSIYKSSNLVISTGGGMIINDTLMMKLKQNGVVIFLDKDPQKIASLSIRDRPLIKSPSDLLALASIRTPLYNKYADITLQINKDTAYHTRELEEKLNEYFSR